MANAYTMRSVSLEDVMHIIMRVYIISIRVRCSVSANLVSSLWIVELYNRKPTLFH